MAERHQGQIELAQALDAEEEADAALRPYQQAFAAAHRALEEAWANPEAGPVERLALYNARLWAGHQRHPYKAHAEEIAGWRKRIEHQLRAANAVIDRLTRPQKKRAARHPPPARPQASTPSQPWSHASSRASRACGTPHNPNPINPGSRTPMPLDTPAKRLRIPAMTKAQIAAAAAATTDAPPAEIVRISRPRLRSAVIHIRGISPYVQHAFSEKQRKLMEANQAAGQQARGKRNRAPKDFQAVYEAAKHVSQAGWLGIPAPAFRNAMISACRLIGFKMTHAKLSVFIESDGIDRGDGTPLVKINGEPRIHEATVRNETGVADIRWRPMWETWSADIKVTWDEDQFSATDVMNLMLRAGLQVGIGEGRPDSPNSNGLGWGRFEIVE